MSCGPPVRGLYHLLSKGTVAMNFSRKGPALAVAGLVLIAFVVPGAAQDPKQSKETVKPNQKKLDDPDYQPGKKGRPDPQKFFFLPSGKMGLLLHHPAQAGKASSNELVKEIQLKEMLAVGWNAKRADNEKRFKEAILAAIREQRAKSVWAKVLKTASPKFANSSPISNLKVSLARAGGAEDKASLYASVQPDAYTFVLKYRVPDNQINCRAEVQGPDVSVRIKFALELTMRIETKGSAKDPLVVQSASISLKNADVDIDSNAIGDALRGIAEFFRDKSFASDVEKSINGKGLNITGELAKNIGPINELLRPFTVDRGFRLVSPRFDDPTRTLQLVMSQQPSATGKVPKAR
jgi:hypothetical protein